MALENKNQLDQDIREAESKDRLLAAFQEISAAMLATLDREEILDTLAAQVVQAGLFRSLMIALVHWEDHRVETVRSVRRVECGDILDDSPGAAFSHSLDDTDILAEVARNGRFEMIEGWDEKRYTQRGKDPEQYAGQVAYFIPVKQGDRVLAILGTGSQIEEREEMLSKIGAMDVLLGQVAVALQYADLHAESRENEERFRMVTESVDEGLLITDKNDIVQFANARLVELTGYAIEEIMGRPAYELFLPEDQWPAMLQRNQRRSAGQTERYELQLRRRDGSQFWAQIIGTPYRDGKGEIIGTLGALTDITERKNTEIAQQQTHAQLEKDFETRTADLHLTVQLLQNEITERKKVEELLQRSNERLNLTLDNLDILAYEIDADGRWLLSRGKALEKLGRQPDEIVGQSVFDYHKDNPLIIATMRRALAGQVQELEVEMRGRIWLANYNPVFDENGRVERMYGIAVDITERKRSEEAVLQSEERYRAVMDQSADCIFLVDVQSKYILEANPALQCLLGYDADELSARTLYDIVAHDQASIDRNIGHIPTQGQHFIGERNYRRKDSSLVTVEVGVNLVSYGGKEVMCVVARDMSERKQLEAQLRQAQKMEAVGSLTTGIAHNFNNRLMVVLNSIEHAIMKGTFDLDLLQRAEDSAERAAEMVDQLMLFSRADQLIERRSVSIGKVLGDTVEICRKTFDRKIDLIDCGIGNLPQVAGDANQLEQVFLNLLLNARDTVEERQPSIPLIQIDARVVADRTSGTGECICIRISDNGNGMDDETQQRVFEPFFTTKEVGQGTGLGLATAYAIVNEHGGRIECEAYPGMGSTFAVLLPIVAGEASAVEEVEIEAPAHGRETILFIEDEEDLRTPLITVLTSHGYQVLVAGDGEEGWELYKRQQSRIDLILLDLSMPKMSGQELLIRLHDLNPEVKVVVSTGLADEETKLLPYIEAFLKKPYRVAQILQTLRQVLEV